MHLFTDKNDDNDLLYIYSHTEVAQPFILLSYYYLFSLNKLNKTNRYKKKEV